MFNIDNDDFIGLLGFLSDSDKADLALKLLAEKFRKDYGIDFYYSGSTFGSHTLNFSRKKYELNSLTELEDLVENTILATGMSKEDAKLKSMFRNIGVTSGTSVGHLETSSRFSYFGNFLELLYYAINGENHKDFKWGNDLYYNKYPNLDEPITISELNNITVKQLKNGNIRIAGLTDEQWVRLVKVIG